MGNGPDNNFDTEGFLFVVKFVFLLAVIASTTLFVTSNADTMIALQEEFSDIEESARDALAAPVQEFKDAFESTYKQAPAEAQLSSVRLDSYQENPIPPVSARAYIIGNVETGEVYLEKNATNPLSIASLTKLMTALVARNVIPSDSEITISQRAIATEGYAGNLIAGDSMNFETILYPLLLESSNDAATAIAEHYGESSFINEMNRRSRELRLSKTVFEDASGLSDRNVSSASDLFRLTQHIHRNDRYIFDMSTQLQRKVFEQDGSIKTYSNNNPFREYEGYVGGKNGWTPVAGKTLLSLFEVALKNGEEQTVAVIVLGSEDHFGDSVSLLKWFENSKFAR